MLSPVAVGGGTINDLTKCASAELQVPYFCVATAASVDGYCSTGAALIRDGFKTTIACDAPVTVIGDPRIMMYAPEKMTSAGYGDLYSKITAGADWLIADSLNIEKIERKSLEFSAVKYSKIYFKPGRIEKWKSGIL